MNAWGSLYGCDGMSGHVPDLLRALSGPEPARSRAYTELSNHLCHQGTVMQVAAAVVPFLVRLIDDPATPDRASLAVLLAAVTVGDLPLPFDVDAAFPEAGNITDEQVRLLVRWLIDGVPEDPVEDFYWDRSGPDRWARDAYLALAAHATTVAGWVFDADPEVASRAAALLAWLPPSPVTLAALLDVGVIGVGRGGVGVGVGGVGGVGVGGVGGGGGLARASANLSLAHLPVEGPAAADRVSPSGVDARLRDLLAVSDEQVALTAAIALAYRHGPATPEPALTMLAVAADYTRPLPVDVPGWDFRALRGYVAIALTRIGW